MMKMREAPGPNPHQYGIIYRPKQHKDDNIVNRNKKIQNELENALNDNKAANMENLKIQFFEDSSRKAKLKNINRTVEEFMSKRNDLLFERRNRLKNLLLSEQAAYEKELQDNIISPLERAAQLREKAKQIRNIKEEENFIFVQKKLDQKWRSECDELRTFQSKFLQSGMRHEHMKQIEEKIHKEQIKLEEEAIFANLWYQDIQAKKDKEDRNAKTQAEKNRKIAEILKEQMLVLDKQKEEEKIIKAQNARLLHEKQNIEKLEKEMQFQKKREDQASRRQELDQCVKLKLINEAKRAREELSYDLKALEDSLISYHNEDAEKAKRKQELMEEQKLYRDYLRAQYEEEKRREKELDRIMDEEVEKQFQKRLNQWKAEKQARKDNLARVLRERKMQIEEKIWRNKERENELEMEKYEMQKMVEHFKEQDRLEKENLINRNKRYGQDLLQQKEFIEMEKKIINDQNEYEFNRYLDAEHQYQKRVNDAMKDIESNNLNRFF